MGALEPRPQSSRRPPSYSGSRTKATLDRRVERLTSDQLCSDLRTYGPRLSPLAAAHGHKERRFKGRHGPTFYGC